MATKHVLIIDEISLLRDYLLSKLMENGVDAVAAVNGLDGVSKLRSIIPDLLIMDYNLSRQSCMDVLTQKKASPSLSRIPVIITAPPIDQKKILELVPYNVKKVFSKPVVIDAMLTSIQELLGVPFNIDKSPGVVEVHVNDDIVFVEITEGLNSDKLDLLRFKIIELIELYRISTPKFIIMISGFTLSYNDEANLCKLLNNILQPSNTRHKNVRILTKDEFIYSYIKKSGEFNRIEVVGSLQDALDGLLVGLEAMGDGPQKAALIGDKVLSSESSVDESMQLRFDKETKFGAEEIRQTLKDLRIAVVDDDNIIQTLFQHIFYDYESNLSFFSNGADFISVLGKKQFDLILLDLIMPRADGFAVLRELKNYNITTPVIVLSGVSQRETVIQAFQMGTKSYLIKPIKPEDIIKKIIEILRVNV